MTLYSMTTNKARELTEFGFSGGLIALSFVLGVMLVLVAVLVILKNRLERGALLTLLAGALLAGWLGPWMLTQRTVISPKGITHSSGPWWGAVEQKTQWEHVAAFSAKGGPVFRHVEANDLKIRVNGVWQHFEVEIIKAMEAQNVVIER